MLWNPVARTCAHAHTPHSPVSLSWLRCDSKWNTKGSSHSPFPFLHKHNYTRTHTPAPTHPPTPPTASQQREKKSNSFTSFFFATLVYPLHPIFLPSPLYCSHQKKQSTSHAPPPPASPPLISYLTFALLLTHTSSLTLLLRAALVFPLPSTPLPAAHQHQHQPLPCALLRIVQSSATARRRAEGRDLNKKNKHS